MRPASSSRLEAARVVAASASVQTAAKVREGMNNLFVITSPSLLIVGWQNCPEQDRAGGKLARRWRDSIHPNGMELGIGRRQAAVQADPGATAFNMPNAPCEEQRGTNEAMPGAFASQTARKGVHQEIGGGVHRQHTRDVVAADEFGPAAFGKAFAEIEVDIAGVGAAGGELQNVAAAHADRGF